MNSKELSQKEAELILEKQNEYFNSQATKDVDFRIAQLKLLKSSIKRYEEQIIEALKKDLGKHKCESYATEIGFVYNSISCIIRNLRKWARPQKKRTPLFLMPAKSYVVSEPYGSVLIIAPFNYPFQLVFEPLAGALAAGNTAVIKTSELAPNVSKVVKILIEETFAGQYVKCVEGRVQTVSELLRLKFGYIFFTGSAQTGKIVMQAAAKNLIPVTLELGGKSPVIVDETANIKTAAEKIIWGKMLNAGQTCVAPDYLLVHEDVKNALVQEMIRSIEKFYGKDIEKSDSYGRIINSRHFNRIKAMIEKDRNGILFGGKTDEKTKYIEPTLIEVSSRAAETMKEEIFWPILPVMTYNDLDKAIYGIKSEPKPLALYLFTSCKKTEKKVLLEVSAGNVTINDTILHIANHNLPFGGTGNSGIGNYHGKYSFTTFSHQKGILKKLEIPDFKFMYPPFTEKNLNIIKWFLR